MAFQYSSAHVKNVGRFIATPMIKEMAARTIAAVEWRIVIQGTDAFEQVRRHEIRIDKSSDRLFDGEIARSVSDGEKIMTALQGVALSQTADMYMFFRRICPDCGAP